MLLAHLGYSGNSNHVEAPKWGLSLVREQKWFKGKGFTMAIVIQMHRETTVLTQQCHESHAHINTYCNFHPQVCHSDTPRHYESWLGFLDFLLPAYNTHAIQFEASEITHSSRSE